MEAMWGCCLGVSGCGMWGQARLAAPPGLPWGGGVPGRGGRSEPCLGGVERAGHPWGVAVLGRGVLGPRGGEFPGRGVTLHERDLATRRCGLLLKGRGGAGRLGAGRAPPEGAWLWPGGAEAGRSR